MFHKRSIKYSSKHLAVYLKQTTREEAVFCSVCHDEKAAACLFCFVFQCQLSLENQAAFLPFFGPWFGFLFHTYKMNAKRRGRLLKGVKVCLVICITKLGQLIDINQGKNFSGIFGTIWRTGAKFQVLFNLLICSNYSVTNYVKIPVF